MVGFSFEQFLKEEAHREKVITIANSIVDNNYTIRQVAANVCLGKSTVHTYIHRDLKQLNPDLYIQVKTILNKHKKDRVNRMNIARRFKK